MDKPSQRRKRGRPPAFDPDDALDAAVDLFWRNGFAKTDLDAVAAAIGATKPSLYRCFGDKRALFRRALDRYAQTTGSAAMQAFLHQDDIALAARAFLETTVDTVSDPAGGPRGCMIACVATEAAETMEDVRDFCADVQRRSHGLITARFELETRKGRVDAATRPETRAQMMIAMMQNLALRARAGEGRATLRADVDESVELLLGRKQRLFP